MLATFNALLRIAQIESGNKRLAFAATDLATILRDVCEFYEPLAADKDQQVRLDLPAVCAGVFDRDLLFQAFANLLDNAIKYAPRGGHIDVRLTDEAQQHCVAVCDDGPGIPQAERQKVFQRFYRVEGSRSLHPGNGLGLSLVQAVINLHGGSVTLGDNSPGLRVSVSLPRAPEPRSTYFNGSMPSALVSGSSSGCSVRNGSRSAPGGASVMALISGRSTVTGSAGGAISAPAAASVIALVSGGGGGGTSARSGSRSAPASAMLICVVSGAGAVPWPAPAVRRRMRKPG